MAGYRRLAGACRIPPDNANARRFAVDKASHLLAWIARSTGAAALCRPKPRTNGHESPRPDRRPLQPDRELVTRAGSTGVAANARRHQMKRKLRVLCPCRGVRVS